MKIRISTKLFTGFTLVVSLMAVLTYYSLVISQGYIKATTGKSFVFLAEETLTRINHSIYRRIEELQLHTKHLMLHNALSHSNREFEKLVDIGSFMNKRDEEWRSTPKQDITPFMQKLIDNDFSKNLRNDFIEFYEKKYGYKLYQEVFVTNKYGANVAQSGKTSDYRQDDEMWWQMAKGQGYNIGNVEYDESSQAHGITIAIKVSDHDDRFLGVMKVVVGIEGLIREEEIYAKRYETTRIKLITKEGKLIYSSNAFKFMEDLSDTELFKKMNNQNGFFISRVGDRKRLYSYSRSKGYREFAGLNWILVISNDVQEVFRPSIELRQKMISASLILIIAGCLITYLMSRSITSPLRELIRGTQMLGKGDLEHRVIIKAKDETGELAAAFNEMAENRLKTETALQKSEERLRSAFENSAIGMALVSKEGKWLKVNRALCNIVGYSEEELLLTTFQEITHPADLDIDLDYVHRMLSKEIRYYEMEKRYFHKNGHIVWIFLSVSMVYDITDEPLYFVSQIQDITERKRADKVIKNYTARLEATNKELDAFTYSVSHDLRAPLRAIDSFSKIFIEDHSGSIDQEGSRILNVIINNTQKMGQLIDNLLAFSRLDRKEIKQAHVDMNRLTDEAMRELKLLFEDRNVQFNIENLPATRGDTAMLREVMINLIANAIKFTRSREKAIIEVGARNERDENIYYVKDNGVGFNMKYADKLFDVFQRLHSSKEFEGTGVGLGIVQRIIQKHGGRVWAEAEVNKGATIFFSLPRKEEHNELSE